MASESKAASKRQTWPSGSKTARKPASRSKIDTLIQCLKRPQGASIATLCKATHWQSHSVRSALSRMHTRGHKVVRLLDKGRVTRYRIDRAKPHGRYP